MKNLSKELIKIYEKNIKILPAENAAHFFSRAFKITRSKKHENILAVNFFITKTANIREALKIIRSGSIKYHPPEKIESERKKMRVELYMKNPKIPFFNELLNDLFFIYKYKLEKNFLSKEIGEINKYLKRENFKEVYLRKETIFKDSSFTINAIFYLKYLGICDFSDEALEMFRDLYFSDDMKLKIKLQKYEFKSLIYSMTHIVIASSKYYNRNVRDCDWVIRYFINNLDYIINNVTLDVLAEVGLCIKITKKEKTYKKEMKKIKDHIKEKFDLKKIIKKIHIVKKEHTSSIIAMLFSENNIFVDIPDLSKNKTMINLINNENYHG